MDIKKNCNCMLLMVKPCLNIIYRLPVKSRCGSMGFVKEAENKVCVIFLIDERLLQVGVPSDLIVRPGASALGLVMI
jgi:hypothetical protein